MKDWRKLFESESASIAYNADSLLGDAQSDTEVDSEASRERIRAELQALVDRDLIAVELERPEHDGKAAGGWEEIWLVVGGAAIFFSAYPGAKEFAHDLAQAARKAAAGFRAIVGRLRAGGNDWVRIPEKGAIVCAWAYAVDTSEDVILEYVAEIKRAAAQGGTYPVGWLVSFTVSGQPMSVLVLDDGSVIGSVAAPDLELIKKLAGDDVQQED